MASTSGELKERILKLNYHRKHSHPPNAIDNQIKQNLSKFREASRSPARHRLLTRRMATLLKVPTSEDNCSQLYR
jgi:hypothetical protein